MLSNINSLGANTLEILPGKDFGDTRSAKIKTLVIADARALAQQPFVAAVAPTVSTSSTLRFAAIEVPQNPDDLLFREPCFFIVSVLQSAGL